MVKHTTNHEWIRSATVLLWILFLTAAVGGARTESASAAQDPSDLTELSLEALLDLEVTSVARKPQSLSDAAAAVFVLTSDDIRRSGATSIPEALRMVPGLQVARIDSNKSAITARGFNGRFANKLLVLIDGRSVYTPLFSGVFWDLQDTLIDDVDRIEIIRGPGATMWGANAVNGVINVMTKTSSETQGTLLTAGGGTDDRGMGSVRYGGRLGDESFYRFFAKYNDRNAGVDRLGERQTDAWNSLRAGIRMDWTSVGDALTIEVDGYDTDSGQEVIDLTLEPPFFSLNPDTGHHSGGAFMMRWNHVFSASEIDVQVSHEINDRSDRIISERRNTSDIDLQHRIPVSDQHDIVWGLGFRSTGDRIMEPQGPPLPLSISPEGRRSGLLSTFGQHDISLFNRALRLTYGAKFEHNDFTGFEVQPNLRALWAPNSRHSVWAAVSRAVRTPSRAERDVTLPAAIIPPSTGLNSSPFPAVIEIWGNPDMVPEKLLAYEGGYRVAATQYVTVDLAAYYNDYTDLRSTTTNAPIVSFSPLPQVVIPLFLENDSAGRTYGAELLSDVRVTESWRVRASYSYLNFTTNLGDSFDNVASLDHGTSPAHQGFIRSSIDLGDAVELDASIRYVSTLHGVATAAPIKVDGYLTGDLRLGWHPSSNVELSINGQNLFQSHHLEFTPELINTISTEVPRGVYGKLRWAFWNSDASDV